MALLDDAAIHRDVVEYSAGRMFGRDLPKIYRCVVSGIDFSFTAVYRPLRHTGPSYNPLRLFLLAGASNLRKDVAAAASPSPPCPDHTVFRHSGIPRRGIISRFL